MTGSVKIEFRNGIAFIEMIYDFLFCSSDRRVGKNEIVPYVFRRGAVIASSFGLYILCFADQNTVNFYRFGNYFYQIIIIL